MSSKAAAVQESDQLTPFASATQVRSQDGSGRYACELSDAWNAPVIPFGGLLSAIAANAMHTALDDPTQPLRTLTTVFASKVPPGTLDIEVEKLRTGRSISQLMARVRNPGDSGPGHVTTGVFGAIRKGFDYTDIAPPEAPPPEECEEPSPPPATYKAWTANAFDHFRVRQVRSKAPWDTDWEAGGPAEAARWIRYAETPRRQDGTVDPYALMVLADMMPMGVGQKLGPGYPLFFGFSCDLTVHLLLDTTSDWFLQRIHCRHAGDGYASGEIEIWDVDRRLVAYATQMMFLNFPKGARSPAK